MSMTRVSRRMPRPYATPSWLAPARAPTPRVAISNLAQVRNAMPGRLRNRPRPSPVWACFLRQGKTARSGFRLDDAGDVRSVTDVGQSVRGAGLAEDYAAGLLVSLDALAASPAAAPRWRSDQPGP